MREHWRAGLLYPTEDGHIALFRCLVFGLPWPAGPTRPQSPPQHLFNLEEEVVIAEQMVVHQCRLDAMHDIRT